MKSICQRTAVVVLLLLITPESFSSRPAVGFYLPDSISEMTLHYRSVKGLIALPVVINDSVHVNLILDTGCRNLILFGKKFTRMFPGSPHKPVQFSGLGNGGPVTGMLALGNKVSIREAVGHEVPVVVVGNNNVFSRYHRVDGIIGYDIFAKFEIELDARSHTITFRPALKASAPPGFVQIPLNVIDSKPVLRSEISVDKRRSYALDLMIDTGSSLALLLKTTNISDYQRQKTETVLGIGLNGPVTGYELISRSVRISGMEIRDVDTGVVASGWHNNASIGMEVLKDYIVVLNYCKSYACLKPNDA